MNYYYRKHFHISKDDRFINTIKIKASKLLLQETFHFSKDDSFIKWKMNKIAYEFL